MKRIVVLGSTGSIGTQTLDVVRRHADKLQVVGLAVGTRATELLAQAREFGVRHLAVGDERLAGEAVADELRSVILAKQSTRFVSECDAAPSAILREGREAAVIEGSRAASAGEVSEPTLGFGAEAVAALAQLPEADIVVNALVGAAGLRASYETLRAGKVLALANKESLVVGGDLIMPLAAQVDEQRRASGVAPATGPAGALMPIDSEHGAIYQCLLGEDAREVSRLWVTASGGPFRGRTRSELANITPAQALAHPTWNMGAKISIDSSTLMNKGLEVIEAHHLFAMPYDRISVVVQPQSAIHSMVEFADGSVKAHLGTTDMRIPIQFALSYPERWDAPVAPLDFRTLGSLEFAAPDEDTFRCLALARHAGEVGGTLPCVMNAANEVAVAAFLAEESSYLGIAACVEAVMDAHERAGVQQVESLDQLEALDTWSRTEARRRLS
ncbi:MULTISPECIES: 1-deoxy-D-xylulose-5-phosphate reductoisomerase [Gordonibacter]|uniref:1-deoxy-D-xylulose 5-phosphate reductoisomerase n=1 Tax=Gordonibacter faecis TaxID=3047475 RepID=A0ABT7DJK8_9ACTN|nr:MULTISPECIES: 1-deoxy-D-xylulose-5-phosphate reductoisomerase [unclassified Gordonibacter]MDJ1649710.1 1-deoxy-D-xylulose-5-phosphate reductoisomerase [Gordonibacter sp. KGMB12511]HIW76514.1 1-deoxy-D-xylulose-5-phosphate reductoisomerase [Candidatus Gordonibacter avicola]